MRSCINAARTEISNRKPVESFANVAIDPGKFSPAKIENRREPATLRALIDE
jgi:hypothetical protein